MRRNKDSVPAASAGDWSSTGTFLRRPPTGWLHEDTELMRGSFIDYEVYYLGCVEVKQSMRTLQFSMRTQITKEAILRLAEAAQKVFMGQKKRKVPKQITKVLGEVDTRTTGDMNLSVSVDSLRISTLTGAEVINHSLPSISFASGGDGPTSDFIGYVAKDPVHSRACHVFECPNSSQYVLATIGQAFELRYKMYLKQPRTPAQPLPVSDSVQGSDSWRSSHGRHRDEEVVTPPTPPPCYDGLGDSGPSGIYSDIPEIPTTVPPPIPASRQQSNPYGNLPNFPPDIEAVSCSSSAKGSVGVAARLGNPYDTMPAEYPSDGVYSDPGEVTTSNIKPPPAIDDYEETYAERPLVSIKQGSTANESNQIDLTPSIPSHDYSNVGLNGKITPETKPHPPKPPRPPITSSKPSVHRAPPPKNAQVSPSPTQPPKAFKPKVLPKPSLRQSPPDLECVYDEPDALAIQRVVSPRATRPGVYDDVAEVLGGKLRLDDGVANGNGYDENVYDDVDAGDEHVVSHVPLRSPKFDDTIYNRIPGNGQVSGSSSPLAPLPRQTYFHGPINRVEAEALLIKDGEFLVRESSKKPGQYVLTGMASGKIQHLLLMDKHGKVKSKDREFDSIPDLVRYFRDKQSALVIGSSQVYLSNPVANAFLT
ncbi:SHC-transforming protein 1-like [Halichondria panicea]|uniref:SHC-transforming protein 1-like n=1 Tax=Halichondria panicea TaxID=6063 RepID=UPI00312BBDDB